MLTPNTDNRELIVLVRNIAGFHLHNHSTTTNKTTLSLKDKVVSMSADKGN
jgi:hypothetical protein